jgi:glycosyltransferase involved in cell wall biosynthesis
MKLPLISVVLPVYNVEQYIEECMNSILNQTFQDFEILVIDDCSTDNTLNIIKSFNDKRIVIIEKEKNKGLIDSLNIGFKAAKGKYIARVDGDDINALERFEKQVKFLEENTDIQACGSWLQAFGKYNTTIRHKETHNEIQAYMLLSNPMSLGATMLSRKAYTSFEFDKTMWHVEDYDFWARTVWNCKLHNLQEVLYYYRAHSNQVSTKFKQTQLENDIIIKLNLFKKIEYNQDEFSDSLLIKIMYSSAYITTNELTSFFKWTIVLIKNNRLYDPIYLVEVLNNITRNIVFDVYFRSNGRKGINKKWRLKALLFLPFKELVFVVRKKLKV